MRQATELPATPFPGIDPYGYAERNVFFARESESRALERLVVINRGSLLYSASGIGKSSLVNAGLVPRMIEFGYEPRRLRVQPRPGQEISIETIEGLRMDRAEAGGEELRGVMSVSEFWDQAAQRAAKVGQFLIFDQFEEWKTLFEEVPPGESVKAIEEAREAIKRLIARLINDRQLPVKVLIALRKDYLAELTPLFELCPDLPDSYLHLAPLASDRALRVIRGPFSEYPGHYSPEFGEELAQTIADEFTERGEGSDISLTELQIVCSKLFEAEEPPEVEFEKRHGVQGILEHYLETSLDSLAPEQRGPAVRMLRRLVTSAGTRNVVSGENLFTLVEQEERIPRLLLGTTLDALETETKLVRRQLRREVYYYEIASEFLVDWIRRREEEYRRESERKKLAEAREEAAEADRRARQANETAAKLRRQAWALAILLVIAATLAFLAWRAQGTAELESLKNTARSQAIEGADRLTADPMDGLRLTSAANSSLLRANVFPEALVRQRLRDVLAEVGGLPLVAPDTELHDLAFSPADDRLAAVGSGGRLWLWQVTPEGLEGPESHAGHDGRASSLAWGANGRWLATAGDDGRVLLWDTAGDSPSFTELPGPGEIVVLDPGVDWIAGYTHAGAVWIWELAATGGTRHAVISTGETDIRQVALHPEDRLLAVAGRELSLWRWDADAEPRRLPLDDPPQELNSVTFSPDGRSLAVGTQEDKTLVWELGGKGWSALEGPRRSGRTVAFGPGGDRLFTAASHGETTRWERSEESAWRPTSLGDPLVGVASLAVSPRGKWLVAGGHGGLLRLWPTELSSGADGHRLRGLEGKVVNLVTWSRDEKWVATLDVHGAARLWAVDSPFVDPDWLGMPTSVAPPIGIHDLAFSAEGRHLAVASDRGVLLWRTGAEGLEERGIWHSSLGKVRTIAYSPDGRWLATGHGRGTVGISDLAASEPPEPVVLEGLPGLQLAFGPGSDWLATAGYEGVVRLWSLKPTAVGTLEEELEGHKKAVRALGVSPDGRWLATGSEDDTAILWDLSTDQGGERRSAVLSGHETRVSVVAFDVDSRWLATGGSDETVRVWDLRAGAPEKSPTELRGHAQGVRAAVFRPGSSMLVTADAREGRIRVWNLGRPASPPQEFTHVGVRAISIDPTGERLLSVATSGALLWSLGAERIDSVELPWETGVGEEAADFSPDGRHVALGSRTGAARIYQIRLRDLLAEACRAAGGGYFTDPAEAREWTPEKCLGEAGKVGD